jgi:hypothetical protein
MSEQEKGLRIEGIVRAFRYAREGQGKQFFGATIECSDGKEWVISYDEQSPYHAFADRRVLASGELYKPGGQHIISRDGRLGRFTLSLPTCSSPGYGVVAPGSSPLSWQVRQSRLLVSLLQSRVSPVFPLLCTAWQEPHSI